MNAILFFLLTNPRFVFRSFSARCNPEFMNSKTWFHGLQQDFHSKTISTSLSVASSDEFIHNADLPLEKQGLGAHRLALHSTNKYIQSSVFGGVPIKCSAERTTWNIRKKLASSY